MMQLTVNNKGDIDIVIKGTQTMCELSLMLERIDCIKELYSGLEVRYE